MIKLSHFSELSRDDLKSGTRFMGVTSSSGKLGHSSREKEGVISNVSTSNLKEGVLIHVYGRFVNKDGKLSKYGCYMAYIYGHPTRPDGHYAGSWAVSKPL